MFASAEIVIREAESAARNADYVILDFRRVAFLESGAVNLLIELFVSLHRRGKLVLLTGTWDKYSMVKLIKRRIANLDEQPLLRCEDIDHAVEWCEDRLLAGQSMYTVEAAPLSAQSFCDGFTERELAVLEGMLEHRRYEKGAYLCREGEPADTLYFILAGRIEVQVPLSHRRTGRITTLSAGSAFGEMAMLDRGVRSADVVAVTQVTCGVLDYHRLQDDSSGLGSQIQLKLTTNIARGLIQKLRRATQEIKALKN